MVTTSQKCQGNEDWICSCFLLTIDKILIRCVLFVIANNVAWISDVHVVKIGQ